MKNSPLKREACWIAHEVAKLHKEKPAETIAILIPARTHLPIFVKELMELTCPFTSFGRRTTEAKA